MKKTRESQQRNKMSQQRNRRCWIGSTVEWRGQSKEAVSHKSEKFKMIHTDCDIGIQ